MQTVRGYIYFENKNFSDIKNAFKNFSFDKALFSYFTSISIDKKILSSPGVFLSGEIKKDYARGHIVKLFRKLLNLSDEIKNYNISLGSVDIIKPIVIGKRCGCYSCLDINRPSILDNIELLAGKIERMFKPKDLFVRTIDGEGARAVCIDMIGESYLDYNSQKLINLINELGLKIKTDVQINLIK